jgi:chromosome segregation ATPase
VRFDQDDSVVSRAEFGRVQRERDSCQRERAKLDQQLRFAKDDYKKLRMKLEEIDRLCNPVRPRLGRSMPPGRDLEQLKQSVEQIRGKCREALLLVQRRLP